MNMIAKNKDQIADALKSLSGDGSTQARHDSEKTRSSRSWKWVLYLTLLASGAAISIIVLQLDLHNRLGSDASRIGLDVLWKTEPTAHNKTEADQTTNATAGYVEPVPVVEAVRQPAGEVTGSGYITAPQSTEIFSRRDGSIVAVHVDLGDSVVADQQLLTLRGETEQFALEKAKATEAMATLVLEARKIDLRLARIEYGRASKLLTREGISQKRFDEVEVGMQRAENQVAQAEQALIQAGIESRIAKHDVDELIVRAPISGTITDLDVVVGDLVTGDMERLPLEQGLMTITDIDDLVIDADVNESNIAGLGAGVVGEALLDAYPDDSFKIVLERIAPTASLQKGTVGLRFRLVDPPFGAKPNMAVRIRLPLSEHAISTENN